MARVICCFGEMYLCRIKTMDVVSIRVLAYAMSEAKSKTEPIYLGNDAIFEIKDYFNYKKGTVKNAITRLKKAGVIHSQGKGMYLIDESVIKFL